MERLPTSYSVCCCSLIRGLRFRYPTRQTPINEHLEIQRYRSQLTACHGILYVWTVERNGCNLDPEVNTEPILAVLRDLAVTGDVVVAEVEAPTLAVQLARLTWFDSAYKPVDSDLAVADTRPCSPARFPHSPPEPCLASPGIPSRRVSSCWIESAAVVEGADAETERDGAIGMDADDVAAAALDAAETAVAASERIAASRRREPLSGTDEAGGEADPTSVKTEGIRMESLEKHQHSRRNQAPRTDVAFDPDVFGEERCEWEIVRACFAGGVAESNFES